MRALTSAMLFGALLASLAWNWRLVRAVETPLVCSPEECAPLADESLSSDVRSKLAGLCASSCSESDRLERRADELQAELLALLSSETLDEAEARRRVEEVGTLRARSLASCVDGILAVRKVLPPAKVRELLERCQGGAAECR